MSIRSLGKLAHITARRPIGRTMLVALMLMLCLGLLPLVTVHASSETIDAATAEPVTIPDEVIAGGTLTFTFTYANEDGYGDFNNIKAIDKIPDGTVFVSGGTYNATTREVTIDQGDLAAGETATFTYAVQVPASLGGTVLNTKNVSFNIEIPGYESVQFGLSFSQDIKVLLQRPATSTTTPTTTTTSTPNPSITPTATPTPDPSATPTPAPVLKLGVTQLIPSTVNPGQLITYTFKAKNQGTVVISQLTYIEMSLPPNTTYRSGGTYNDSTKKITYPDVTNLAVGAESSFTLVVEIAADAAINSYIDSPSFIAYYPVGGGSLSGTGYNAGQFKTTVIAAGTVVATYKNAQGVPFSPDVFGYGFQNYGSHAGAADDLGVADVFDLFGPSACQNSSPTRANCQLTAAGNKWLQGQLSSMNGGHCEGMAVTASRFFEQLSFDGKTNPSDFQTGRANVYDLVFPNQSIENYVASYFVRQGFNEVYLPAAESRNLTPSGIVDKLIEDFNKTPSVGYALGVYKPGYKAGHAITPYAVERIGNTDVYRIVVYDNNFPGQKRYVTVDKSTNTWTYVAAADPTQPASTYEGNAKTKTLEINAISLRDKPTGQYFPCPFCSSSQLSASETVSDTIEVSFDGEGEIQIVDDQGRRAGYDFDTGSILNEIANVESVPLKHGLGLALPPVYTVPYLASDGLYQVYLGGATVEDFTSGDLYITGQDFVMGVEALNLGANEMYRLDISPDGNEIYFEATADTIAPALFMAFEPLGDNDPGLIVEIDGMLLKANEVAYIGVDTDQERIFFVATNDTIPVLDRNLALSVTAYWPDGTDETKSYNVELPKGTPSAYLDYGNWTEGNDAPIVIEHKLYLPMLIQQ